jgi:hypothetical protein
MIRRAPRLFRAAALFAVLGMVLGWMELAVPDVHDGHGAAEFDDGAWTQLSDGPPSAPADEPGHAPQAPHTCHCIHAHAPALPAATGESPRLSTNRLGVASTEATLASFTPDPHFRPPVA